MTPFSLNIKPTHWLVGIVLLSAFLISKVLQDGHHWGGDFSLYIQQTEQIAKGQALNDLYDWNKVSMQNSSEVMGPYLYPNGFPLLLSTVYMLFGIDFIAMKVFCSLFFLMALPLIYILFRPYFDSNVLPLLLAAFVAFNFYFIVFSNSIMSDFPFFFCCLATFNWMASKNNLKNQLLLGVLFFYSYFIRDVGIFLVPTYAIYQWIHWKKYNTSILLTALPYGIFILLFVTSKTFLPNGGANHMDMLLSGLQWEGIYANAVYYATLFSKILFFQQPWPLVGAVVFLLGAIGLLSNKKKHLPFAAFLCMNLLTLLVWPSRQGARFLFPIIPFLMFFTFQGMLLLTQTIKVRKYYLNMVVVVLVVVFSGHSYFSLKPIFKRNSNQAYTKDMVEIYQYISNHIPDESIVGFKKPRVLWLFSNTKSIHTDSEHFEGSIADYWLVVKPENGETPTYEVQEEFDRYILYKK